MGNGILTKLPQNTQAQEIAPRWLILNQMEKAMRAGDYDAVSDRLSKYGPAIVADRQAADKEGHSICLIAAAKVANVATAKKMPGIEAFAHYTEYLQHARGLTNRWMMVSDIRLVVETSTERQEKCGGEPTYISGTLKDLSETADAMEKTFNSAVTKLAAKLETDPEILSAALKAAELFHPTPFASAPSST